MARAKPTWRKILNARFLRWWGLRLLVRLFPALGRRLAFFPDHVDMIAAADKVLMNEVYPIPAEEITPHMDFLRLCDARDSKAADLKLPNGAVTGRRTALYTRPWIDSVQSSVLLPDRGQMVLVRGESATFNAISARFNRKRVDVPGRVFAPLVTRNYFHLLLENGVRLLDLLESGLVSDAPLTIVTPAGGTKVETALYQGICALHPCTKLKIVDRDALVLPDEAVIHFPPDNYWEWPPLSRDATDRLAEAFDAVYGDAAKTDGPEVLHISRSGAKLRTLSNQDAFETALADRGAQTFIATYENHAEQIAKFRAARVVIGVHGAGLTNLAFCAPGTRVIEIFPENSVKSPYWWMAHKLGLDYRPIISGPGDYHLTFEADIEAVMSALEDA
ncbi:MAG: glycosyltransferase 61 family protein [Pseudomonadota bacterium]